MTKEDFRKAFMAECTKDGDDGKQLAGKPEDIMNWIENVFYGHLNSPFKTAFTGMRDKNGNPICEGSRVKLYYKGEFVVCTVLYDEKHAAFFLRWPDGYVNQYFMNGSNYELVDDRF